MIRVHPVGLAVALAPLVCMVADDAVAADVFDAPTVAIVPVGAVAGDGSTTVTLQVLAREPDGSALTGLKGKRPSATEGSTTALRSMGDGWYAFDFTPPTTSQHIDVTLSLSAGSYSSELEVPVVPAGRGSLTIAPNPPSMVLGREDGVSVSFTIDGDLPGTDLELAASSGELSDLTDMGGGSWTARYTAPSVNYPHLAILSAVSRNQPEQAAVSVVRLQGAVDFPVTAEAGSSVVLRIADRDYGPVKMDASGKGKVPIIVSPGINEARKIVVKDGKRDEAPFDLQIPETRRIAFVPLVGAIPADGSPHPVRVAVRKPDGSPEGGASLTVSADSGKVGAARHLGDGIYEVDFTPAEAGDVTLQASLPGSKKNITTINATVLEALPDSVAWDALDGVPTAPKGSGVAGVVIVPKARVLVGDDAETTLFIAAVDRFGYPVPGESIALEASDGTLTTSVKTGSTGIATATLKGPKSTGMVRITGSVGEWTTRTGLVATDAAIDAVWPRSEGVQGDWEGRLPSVAPKAAVAMTAPEDPEDPDATSDPEEGTDEPGLADGDVDVASVIVTLPKAIAPGSSATISARALSDDGLAVTGESMDFLTNAGTFGPVEDAGDGTYTSELTIPKKASGELKVSVVAESGAMARETLPIDPGAVANVPKPRPTKTPSEKGDLPFLRTRVGAAFGSYSYAQRPTQTPGPLLPGSLIVGGSEGGRAAPVGGVELDSRAWFIDYVGVHVGFRAGRYTITADTFSENAPDWLYHFRANLTGRYPIAFGKNHLWFGASAGFQIDDFIVFKGDCLQAGCTVEYEPLTLPGFEVGGEIGVEVGRIHGVTNLSRGLAFGTVGYRTGWDLDVGVSIIENLYADIGLSVIGRRLDVEGDTTGTPFGELQDTQTIGRLSLGFQL